MYIKDLKSGEVRKYGSNNHDALRVSRDGTILSYENLQNGDGSRFGDYRFCDEDGLIPEDDEVLVKYGADAYFNIGGFVETPKRKCGKWNAYYHGINETPSFTYSCNQCGYSAPYGLYGGKYSQKEWNFCPNCGAEMREETNE